MNYKIDYDSTAYYSNVKDGKVCYYVEYSKNKRIVYTKKISKKEMPAFMMK